MAIQVEFALKRGRRQADAVRIALAVISLLADDEAIAELSVTLEDGTQMTRSIASRRGRSAKVEHTTGPAKKVAKKRRPMSPENRAKLAQNLVKARAARAAKAKATKKAARKTTRKQVTKKR